MHNLFFFFFLTYYDFLGCFQAFLKTHDLMRRNRGTGEEKTGKNLSEDVFSFQVDGLLNMRGNNYSGFQPSTARVGCV